MAGQWCRYTAYHTQARKQTIGPSERESVTWFPRSLVTGRSWAKTRIQVLLPTPCAGRRLWRISLPMLAYHWEPGLSIGRELKELSSLRPGWAPAPSSRVKTRPLPASSPASRWPVPTGYSLHTHGRPEPCVALKGALGGWETDQPPYTRRPLHSFHWMRPNV